MDESIVQALNKDRLIDITTIGRKTGQPHRIEIGFHYLAGEVFIAGTPGPRSWLANLIASPEFTFHVKGSIQADLPAKATQINVESKRREIFTMISERGRTRAPIDIEAWVAGSALVQVEFLESN